MDERRRRIEGVDAVAAALARGETVRVVLFGADLAKSPRGRDVLAAARAAGARVLPAGHGVLRRFAAAETASDVVAMVGPDPAMGLDAMLARRGAAWLLAGVAYAVNVGFALRTAEVSGADGVIVATSMSAARRRTALRASMRADRLLPVLWEDAGTALAAARRAGRRIVAVEDRAGARAPWDADLSGPVLLVVGGESGGIAPDVLARCDDVVLVPMAGFIPSYNVQAAMAAVAAERLRQTGA